jgi:hypothetical protein
MLPKGRRPRTALDRPRRPRGPEALCRLFDGVAVTRAPAGGPVARQRCFAAEYSAVGAGLPGEVPAARAWRTP